MGILGSSSSNVMLGLIAGMTIFLGLPVARIKNASEAMRGTLALASAGVLLFLIIEVGYHAIETVEGTAKSGDINAVLMQGAILIAGLCAGLIGLAWYEEERIKKRTEGAQPLDIATMIATGIGLHNFAEGLAIGQSFSGGQSALGIILVIGFALHNATEGFGIAAPLAGQEVSWGTLTTLGIIGGLPTALGSYIGGVFVNQNVELLFLSLAVGSLIYVTRELLRLRFNSLKAVPAMTALAIGLLAGIGTEIFVEVASVGTPSGATASIAGLSSGETSGKSSSNSAASSLTGLAIRFEPNRAEPGSLSVKRGDQVTLQNETNRSLEFENSGLLTREAYVPAHSKLVVDITGRDGAYSLSPETGGAGTARITVSGGKTDNSAQLADTLAAITTIAGHASAALDLHERAVSGNSQHAAVDLKRAGKHSHHPMHELLEDKTPRALAVQAALQKVGELEPIKQKLRDYSKIAGDKTIPQSQMERNYKAILDDVDKARNAIGGTTYQDPEFREKVVLAVLAMAEGEYKEAVAGGSIQVVQAAVPGKDMFLEYQDTRGFLKACDQILNTLPTDDFKPDGRESLRELLGEQLKSVDPQDAERPIPFHEIEEQFERIERSLS